MSLEPDLLAVLIGRLWLVWSNEHAAWWGPNERGYVTDIESAGRYTLEEAQAICEDAGRFPPAELRGSPPELIQPSPEWLAARAAAIARVNGAAH